MIWRKSSRFDARARALADRHYNRQKPGTPQFMPSGSCLVLLTDCGNAVWGTSWPRYAKHAWSGAWVNSIFRNEGAGLSSDLIRAAVAATLAHYGEPPPLGMITFVDANSVRDGLMRGRQIGRCYIKAGFREVGRTEKRGYHAFQLLPADMPEPSRALDAQADMFGRLTRNAA